MISVHIVDKERGFNLYSKNFIGSEIETNPLLAGGIAGVAKVIQELTASDQNLDEIRKEDNLIMLEHGRKTIIAIVTKKNLLNARFFLQELTFQFESAYLEWYDMWKQDSELFKPVEFMINNLIKI